MTSRTLLKTYRTVRDVVAGIQQTAADVDEHLGRFQVYGADEELHRAMKQAESLSAKAVRLELELRLCAMRTHSGLGMRTTEPARTSSEWSTATVS